MNTANAPVLLITTLAEYQTDFWLEVGRELRRLGHTVAFLSFDDRSTDTLRTEGFETFAATPEDLTPDTSDPAFDAALKLYGIEDVNFWFAHERVTFAIRDGSELRRKMLGCLGVADRACRELKKDGKDVAMVQELGGFISVIASFFAARHHGIDNWFIEPAFFRGRLFFLRNSFKAPSIPCDLPEAPSTEVRSYLSQTLGSGAIVIPVKDRHQYTTAWHKVVNRRNLVRLAEKLADKYIYRKRQEFGHIGRHVAVHMRMLRSSLKLRNHYTDLSGVGRFIYYPLHVPGDMALTLRSPQYLDQLAFVDYLARSVPHTHLVAIKEHPAMIGAIDANRVIELLRRHDNVKLVPPTTNNYDVLRAADAVVSVNSKSGAEAALVGKPVLVLGDAFYRGSPLVTPIQALEELAARLKTALSETAEYDAELVAKYFEAVWRRSHAGELYVSESENVRAFVGSLVAATNA